MINLFQKKTRCHFLAAILASLSLMGSMNAQWGSETQVSGDLTSFYPIVASDGAGNTYCVWMAIDPDSNYIVQFSKLPLGGSWSTPVTISAESEALQPYPVMVVDPVGNIVVAWSSFNGTSYVIEAAILPIGGSWIPLNVISNPVNSAFDPVITATGSGTAVVIWTELDGSNYTIQSITYSLPVSP